MYSNIHMYIYTQLHTVKIHAGMCIETSISLY